jgi:hypothetical protein
MDELKSASKLSSTQLPIIEKAVKEVLEFAKFSKKTTNTDQIEKKKADLDRRIDPIFETTNNIVDLNTLQSEEINIIEAVKKLSDIDVQEIRVNLVKLKTSLTSLRATLFIKNDATNFDNAYVFAKLNPLKDILIKLVKLNKGILSISFKNLSTLFKYVKEIIIYHKEKE